MSLFDSHKDTACVASPGVSTGSVSSGARRSVTLHVLTLGPECIVLVQGADTRVVQGRATFRPGEADRVALERRVLTHARRVPL